VAAAAWLNPLINITLAQILVTSKAMGTIHWVHFDRCMVPPFWL
jgi:hypothetical protein